MRLKARSAPRIAARRLVSASARASPPMKKAMSASSSSSTAPGFPSCTRVVTFPAAGCVTIAAPAASASWAEKENVSGQDDQCTRRSMSAAIRASRMAVGCAMPTETRVAITAGESVSLIPK